MMSQTVEAVVKDRGSDELISVPASATVAEAVDLDGLRATSARCWCMTEDGLVAGIFSERDLLVRVVHAGRDPKTTPMSMVMTRDVRFVSPGTTIEAALALMHVQRFRHLLVIDGPRMHGLVSMRDLVYQMIRRGEGRFEAAVREAAPGDPRQATDRIPTMDTLLSPRRRTLLQALGAAALVAGCGDTARRRRRPAYEFRGPTMGSTYSVKIAGAALVGGGARPRRATRCRPRSPPSTARCRRTARTPSCRASTRTRRRRRSRCRPARSACSRSRARSARATGGAFDITVAPVVDAWGFGPGGEQRVVDPAEIGALEPRVGWQMLALDAGDAHGDQARPDLAADLSGIAKGYGVDRAALALDALGISRLHGRGRRRGPHARPQCRAPPWQIAIERPDAMPQRPHFIVPLAGQSMATSGDYRIWFERDGRALLPRDRSRDRRPISERSRVRHRRRGRLRLRRRDGDRADRAGRRAAPGAGRGRAASPRTSSSATPTGDSASGRRARSRPWADGAWRDRAGDEPRHHWPGVRDRAGAGRRRGRRDGVRPVADRPLHARLLRRPRRGRPRRRAPVLPRLPEPHQDVTRIRSPALSAAKPGWARPWPRLPRVSLRRATRAGYDTGYGARGSCMVGVAAALTAARRSRSARARRPCPRPAACGPRRSDAARRASACHPTARPAARSRSAASASGRRSRGRSRPR